MSIDEPINSEPEVLSASEAEQNLPIPKGSPTGRPMGISGGCKIVNCGSEPCSYKGVEPPQQPEDTQVIRDEEDDDFFFREVDDSRIFYVCEDGVPIFYASDAKTAISQLEAYLIHRVDTEDNYNYFIDKVSATEYHLCSRNDYYVVNFDCVENVYKIDTMTKVRKNPHITLP